MNGSEMENIGYHHNKDLGFLQNRTTSYLTLGEAIFNSQLKYENTPFHPHNLLPNLHH